MRYIVYASLGGEREGEYSGIIHSSKVAAEKEMKKALNEPGIKNAWIHESTDIRVMYADCDTITLTRQSGEGHEDTPYNGKTFKIVFEADRNKKLTCIVEANSLDEAFGIFFVNHPTATFNMVWDYTEHNRKDQK